MRIPITLTDSEHKYLKEESKRTGLPIAELIRILINDYKVDLTDNLDREYDRNIWRRIIKARDKYICFHCNTKHKDGKTCEAHHVKPVKEGGKNILTNGVTMCRTCHRLAHNQFKDIYKL